MEEEKNIKEVTPQPKKRGQSLVEYTLILALLGIAMGFAIAATGPAVGNVFSNVVFNLLRQTPEGNGPDIAGPVDFWLTVTYVHQNPQQEQRLPTRTPLPPTPIPTDGPSPTPTPITPTVTPLPTNTPVPTPIPPDLTVIAPWTDNADPYANTISDPEHWRVDNALFTGYDEWYAEFFPNRTLSGAATDYGYISEMFPGASPQELNFDWGSSGPIANWPSGNVGQNYSARFTREIYIETTSPVRFIPSSNDGIRVWLDYTDGCAAAGGVSSPPTPGQGNGEDDRTFGDPATHCLLIDDWEDQGMGSTPSVTRTIPAGLHTITVEMYQGSSSSGIALQLGASVNPDDTVINDSGVPTGGIPDCNWGRREDDNDSASPDFMWEEYVGGSFARNARCHLEFRGAVYIPPEVPQPEMVFWDVWDMDSGNQRGWLEITEYIEATPGEADRAAMAPNWQRIDLRQGNTLNYNWTRNVVDLSNVNGVNYAGKLVAFRFVMENRNNGGTRRWYVDDIEFRNRDLHGIPGGPAAYTIGDQWDFEELPADPNNDMQDFIFSARWDQTTNYPAQGSTYSMQHSNGRTLTDFSESPYSTSNFTRTWIRTHYMEFNGWVDISGGLPDLEGDIGNPMLSFQMGYIVGRYTGIEVQYTTDAYGIGADNWQVVPGIDPSNPYGRIRDVADGDNNNGRTQGSMREYKVPLTELVTNGITRIRLRFALLVTNAAYRYDGMWIDDVYIEREGEPGYLNYPFYDSAESSGVENWLTSSWWRTNEQAYEGGHAFTDSPGDGVNYVRNSNTFLRTIDPIDFFNDTPANLALDDRNSAGGNGNNPDGVLAPAATNPVLTFWHSRRINSYDAFYVEWRRINETDSEWKQLWVWQIGMNTRRNENSWESRQQDAWERVVVDLSTMFNQFSTSDGDPEDDDILFRFRLYSDNNSNVDDGVYVDNIAIEERPTERVHRLWGPTNNRSVGGVNYGTGTSGRYAEDFDSSAYWENWHVGGNWEIIEWETQNGLRAATDSTGNGLQIAAPNTPIATFDNITQAWTIVPISVIDINTTPPEDIPLTYSQNNTFSVLEMNTIIDLRATEVAENPTLYFWTRYYVGNDDRFSVEISYELTSNIDNQLNNWCGSNRPNCYEHEYGWSEWQEVWYRDEWDRNWAWNREQISLAPWAASGLTAGDTPGDRIRIRFVSDAYRNNDNRDGVYVDNIVIGPRQDGVIRRIADQGFSDNASNLTNWVTEGNWGLSPELFRDVNGGPATLGTWTESWWNCNRCYTLESGGSFSSRVIRGADTFLDDDGNTQPAGQNYTATTRTVLDVQYDMRRGTPRPGVTTYTDRFVGRWTLDTPVVGSGGVDEGDYTFITLSDDGVRMKYEEIDAGGTVIDTDPSTPTPDGPPPIDSIEWNMIYNWTNHGRTADMGVASLEEGKRYRITLEYFENSSDATIILTVGGSAFSFTDAPKQGAGPAFFDMPSIPYSSSSLILNGTLDLEDTTNPILEYYTYYEIDGRARVEVSIDGGFTWRNNGLGNGSFDSPSYSGRHMPGENDGDWRLRRHDLSNYAGLEIMLRFRFDRYGRGSDRKSVV